MTPARARTVHLVVAAVAWFALVFQLVLVIQGSAVLVEDDPPGMATRVGRFFAYFTIQSNILVAYTSTQLARDPVLDQPRWRAVRDASLIGITVTGLVHFFLLRPLLDLDGADWLADKLLHMVVPVLALAAWVWVGPRPRVTWRDAAYALLWPVVWLAFTLGMGQVSGWVPYPFLDAETEGWASVVVVSIGITVLLLALAALLRWLDRKLPPAPR
jgi:hypothetical protein